ncbi:MAG: right-handed parallel beta-helix repeat-containing protein [Spirochaetes bacterium]|nr:right-handed parallel beta-helix repeat-containing protein [Spirochaetota bacterium]
MNTLKNSISKIKWFYLFILLLCCGKLFAQPYYVDDNSGNDGNPGTFANPFKTIQKGANMMMPGVSSPTCYIFPGNYPEKVTIASNKNLGYIVFTKLSNTEPIMNGSLASNYAIQIINAGRVIISGLIIKSYIDGIILDGIATNNIIKECTIYSNDVRGICLNSDTADNNYIFMNNVWGMNQDYGIFISNGDNNIIRINQIHNNQQYGVYFAGSATGNYIAKNTINSNNSRGIYITSDTADNNYILTNNVWGMNQVYGIYISDGDNNSISSNQIHDQLIGINFSGSATGNYITKNTIYSNADYGILINSDTADNNYILTNNLWGMNQDYGVYIINGDNNTIGANQIHNNQLYGINFENSATGNYITENTIYSNANYGIYINSDTADNNYILTNNIWGINQDYGVYILDGDSNTIGANQIHNNQQNGIYFTGSATGNYITKNTIYSNPGYGILINSEDADNNYILTNNLWGINQNVGAYINNGDNNKIYRNLFNRCPQNIGIGGSGIDNNIINNTIFGSSSDGIRIENTSAGTLYNNIILSNSGFGLLRTSSGAVFARYNDFYGNLAGPTQGGISWGSGNVLTDPLLETAGFTITSASSPAVDSGIVYPGVSDAYNGLDPDMGWKEWSPTLPSDSTAPTTTVSKDSGIYTGELQVILTASDLELPDNLMIYYTTDGTDPKSSSTVKSNSSPVTIIFTTTTTLKFYAKNEAGLKENVQERIYQFALIPKDDVAVYNNHLDLSKGEKARIIFGKPGYAEIKIYTMRGVLVQTYPRQYYNIGDSQVWDGTVHKTVKKAGAGLYIVVIQGDINKKSKIIVKK